MRSPIDRATVVFYSCFVDNYCLSCNVSTLLPLFLLPKMAARGRARPEVTSPIESLTPTWYRSALEFCVYLLPVKSYATFRFACKMPSENSGEGVHQ
jgi:hypothetical protein